MKASRLALLATLAISLWLCPLASAQSTDDDVRYQVRIQTSNATATGERLHAAGFDVVRVNPAGKSVDLVVTSAERDALRRQGFRVTTLDRVRPLSETLQAEASASLTMAAAALAPGGYPDLDGITAQMQALASSYPSLVQFVDLTATYGTPVTVQGRHLFALKISDNVVLDEDEPSMLIVAAHHAREVSTPIIALRAAERLAASYGIDPEITAAVDTHEIWIAPVWNPDGYNHVFTTDNMWRKNRRPFASATGVDQNRNYPAGWGTSCNGSTSAAAEDYRGPASASEAETQTMMVWSQRERFAKVIDYHSYGREVLYGYRCLPHPFSTWMRQEAAALSSASGYGGLTRVPSAEGEHQEWQFARMGAWAFLIETHTQFQPPYASAVTESDRVWPGILAALRRAIPLAGHVVDGVTRSPLAAKIEILNLNFTQGETNSSGGSYGAYHVFAPAGVYDVRFSAPGYVPVTARVSLSATAGATLDVELFPAPPPPPEQVIFFDDLEQAGGWTINPALTDTATSGRWERCIPQATSSSGPKQLGTTASGVNALVTGCAAGSSSGANDVDGGRTSIQSATIVLPTDGSLQLTFRYYLAHGNNSSSADYLRVSVVGATKVLALQELGAADNDDAVWATASYDLSAFAGQSIRLLIEANDSSTASLVEAAVDDVKIVRR
jgi:carboxypeptidase T